MWDQFIPGAFQTALGLDGNPLTSVAMSSKASTPTQISMKFDQISYGKGEEYAAGQIFLNGLKDSKENAL